ncbi:ABC-type oligopeptide transporter ABCB9 isoform X4 [Gracilinanus agilis]|uniref:ABC-type oligopeptide transporter ABCB9 isoform X4 n=1 Tax=Gracilinanus agilis TaxID=191870 RepID=UPI001CFF4E06|nr:ABC-type oligopeptide transporter ABCB9 isoform X4 [Gracilinanus agilis]
MRTWKAVAVTGAFMSVDVSITTVLYAFSHRDRDVLQDLRDFNIFDSVLDLWAACLYRSCLLLGATIGVAKNSALGPRRLRASWTFITLVCLFVGIYTMVKMLLFSEIRKPIRDPWFWGLFVWTYASIAATFFLWWLLSTVQPGHRALETGAPGEGVGYATEGQPKQEEASGATLQKLLSYTKPDLAFLVAASFFLVVAALGETFLPYYTGRAIDGIVIQKSMDQFSTAVVIMCLLAIGSSFAAGIRGGIFTLVFARLNIRLRNCLFRSLVSQETSFFDENRTGDLISRLTSDTTMVSDLVSQNINIFLRNTVKVTGVVVFMFSLSWQLSLVTFMGFPIIMMVSDIYGKYYKRLSKEVQNALARASNTAEETISAMKTVRSFANEEEEAEVYARKLQQVYKLNRKEAMAYTYYVWGSGLTLLVVQVSILYYGGHLVISGQMTSGNLISFIIYEFVLGDCMENVSFTLSPGKVTALVGPSGSGKSSCVNILENFYPLEEGRVLLDGKPISSYDHKYLHRVISLVSQEPVLFARSITDNISYGLPTVPFEMVVDAAQKANAHGFIMELQDGYNTETGEKGAQLSGGQKQRVAMARALVRNPPVLILDEATSALDAESEYMIQQAIHGNLQKHTVLIIAHRLSTVEKAHSIIVLDKGRVVQQGTHKQLLTQGGLYAKLVQRQILGLEAGSDDDSGGSGSSRQEMMLFTSSHKEPPDGHSDVHKA